MKIFLELKHWQLFLLIVGIPFLAGILETIVNLASQGNVAGARLVLKLLNLLPLWIFYLWIWSVGFLLSDRLKQQGNLHYKMRYFPWLLITSALLSTLLIIFFSLGRRNTQTDAADSGVVPATDFSYLLLVILVFLALAGLFTSLNYMAKIVVSAERKPPVRANDFFSEYVMALLFPAGIWFLQPRINQLAKNYKF